MSDEEAVEKLVERLRSTVNAEVSKKTYDIPPLPQVAMDLHKIASAKEPDLQQALKIIERDVEIAGKVLSLASSAAFGAWAEITNLRQAVVRIGANGLRNIAFALTMSRVFKCGPLQPVMEQENQRAYVLACASALICRKINMEADYGFLCGLLADVGRPAVLATLARLSGSRQGAKTWLRPDVVHLSMDRLHEDLGPMVIERWGLQPLVKEVSRYHQRPHLAGGAHLPDDTFPMAYAVAAADRFRDLEGDPGSEDWLAVAKKEPLLTKTGLSEEQLPDLAEVIKKANEDAAMLAG